MTTNTNTHTARGLLLHTNGHALPVHIAQNDDEDIRTYLGINRPLTGKLLWLGPLDDEGYCLDLPDAVREAAPASLRPKPRITISWKTK